MAEQNEEHYFEQAALEWDRNPLVLDIAEAVGRNLRERVGLTSAMAVMEYGCGTGLVALDIAAEVASVAAWDSSPGMLSMLQSKLKEKPGRSVEPRLIDLTVAEAPERRFDLIYSSMALHHVAEVSPLIARLAGLLNAGGRLCLIDLDTEDGSFHEGNEGAVHNGFDRIAISKEMNSADLERISVHTAHRLVKTDLTGAPRHYSLFCALGSKRR